MSCLSFASGQRPKSIANPKTANRKLAVRLTHFMEIRSVSFCPKNTARPSEANIPAVVPAVTISGLAYFAPRATVASCVLSPISARKNATRVVRKAPNLPASLSSSSLSGINIQTANARNVPAKIHARICGDTNEESQPPAQDARAWLSKVAARMPPMMVQGFLNLEASTSARSWVLSPISLAKTNRNEFNAASMETSHVGREVFWKRDDTALLNTNVSLVSKIGSCSGAGGCPVCRHSSRLTPSDYSLTGMRLDSGGGNVKLLPRFFENSIPPYTMAHTIRDKAKIIARVNRIRGQLEAFGKAIETEQDEYQVMQLLASCRGAMNGLMSELVEGHIREHIVEAENKKLASEAGEELIDIVRSFLK